MIAADFQDGAGETVNNVSRCCTSILAMMLQHGPVASADEPASIRKERTLIDYFLPIPIKGKLTKDAWGAAHVGRRDQDNGLEDRELKQWCYWDGSVLEGADGKWHMFASRWSEPLGHEGWWKSLAVHAVSDDVLGPYEDKGVCWPENENGLGHNVNGAEDA
jgi:hypothetical protein